MILGLELLGAFLAGLLALPLLLALALRNRRTRDLLMREALRRALGPLGVPLGPPRVRPRSFE